MSRERIGRKLSALQRGAGMARYGADLRSRSLLFLLRVATQMDRSRRRIVLPFLLDLLRRLERDGLIEFHVASPAWTGSADSIRIVLRAGDMGDYQSICECLGSSMYPVPGCVIHHVLDGGAHIGFFALSAVLRLPELRSIVLVEPDPRNLALLEENTRLPVAVDLLPVALDAESGPGRLELSESNQSHLRTSPGPLALDRIVPVERRRILEVVPADWEMSHTWIKLDIEGAEYGVIHELLESTLRPAALSLEAHDFLRAGGEELVARIRDCGYRARVEGFGESGNVCRQISAAYEGSRVDPREANGQP